MAQMGLKQT